MVEHTFLFITDTHTGNDGTGWARHPLRPDLLARTIPALNDYIARHDIAFLLHGGDIIDDGSALQRDEAGELWGRLRVPCYLCLGNHDLAQPDAYLHWLSAWPALFGDGGADYMVECGGADVYVLANVWHDEHGELLHWWNPEYPNCPGLLDTQLQWLDDALASRCDRPAILVVHAPLDPLPSELTGLPEAIHIPEQSYVQPLEGLLARRKNVRLVLSGHCHATCVVRHGRRIHVMTSAFSEPPFEVRRVTIGPNGIVVDTICPIDHKRLGVQQNQQNLWSAGRPCDLKVGIAL